MQIVILAGGLATRLRPLTLKLPKSLIPINDERPFLDYQLKALAKEGFKDIVLSIGFEGEQIVKYAGDGSHYGLKIQYVKEGEKLLGTGGALRLAYDQGVLQGRFLMTYGDSFLPVSFRAAAEHFTKNSDFPSLMTVFENSGKYDSSNVIFDGRSIVLYDKKLKMPQMRYIDYGLSAFTRDTIRDEIPPGEVFDLALLQNELSIEKKLLGWEVKERFYEIGSHSGLEEFRKFALEQGL